jgi:hypothetical protein
MMRPAMVVLVCALLAGCESDEAQLERLQLEARLATLEAEAKADELAEIREAGLAPPAALDSIGREVTAAQTRATLAERELRRFLR